MFVLKKNFKVRKIGKSIFFDFDWISFFVDFVEFFFSNGTSKDSSVGCFVFGFFVGVVSDILNEFGVNILVFVL